MTIDAEYCATLDHTGKPISEYGKYIRWNNEIGSTPLLWEKVHLYDIKEEVHL